MVASIRRGWRRVAVAVVVAAVVVAAPQAQSVVPAVHAATPAAKKPPLRARPLCAWPTAAIGRTRFGNTGFIDTDASYLLMSFGYLSGTSLKITGEFPYARYMSFAVYSGRASAGTVLLDHITDRRINPIPGNVNPFRPLANRFAARRRYTIYVVQGRRPANGGAPNTLYTGPYHPALVMYRVYAPDQNADDFGSVPKPSLSILAGTPDSFTRAFPLPVCTSPRRASAKPNIAIKYPLRWQLFGTLGQGGVNGDDAYLEMRLNHDDNEVTEIRFKAPTFPDTYIGQRITGRENVRFWSICMYDMLSTKVVACLHDYQAVKVRGYVTVVISTLANKPRSATPENGINWLPFGLESIGVLNYRQLLPSPYFRGSFLNVAPDAYQFELKQTLGRYLPTISTCSTLSFTPRVCSDVIDPQFCNDLTEPSSCGQSAVVSRLTSLVRGRVAGYRGAVLSAH